MQCHKVTKSSFSFDFKLPSIDSNIDYRYSSTAEVERLSTFISPVDSHSDEVLNKIFQRLSGNQTGFQSIFLNIFVL